jgi:hypothetical protein
MKKTQPKIEPPQFDEEGYQINMTSLNGEPLPDVSEWKAPARHQVQGFPLSDSVQYDRVESGGMVTLSPRPKGGARVGAGRASLPGNYRQGEGAFQARGRHHLGSRGASLSGGVKSGEEKLTNLCQGLTYL